MDNFKLSLERNGVLQKGDIAVISASSSKRLHRFLFMLPTCHTVVMDCKLTKEVIETHKKENIYTFIIPNYVFSNQTLTSYRQLAMLCDVCIIIGTVFTLNNKERLSRIEDYPRELRDSAVLLIGLTNTGVHIDKNRGGDIGEITFEEALTFI